MTVGVLIKVFDGLVLAADSATTLRLTNGESQVWNNADKIFNLHRGHPVAAMTWGLGSVGAASISTLCKELRRRLMGDAKDYADWALGEDFSIEEVVERLIDLIWGEVWCAEYPAGTQQPGVLGLLVAGYPAGSRSAKAYEILIEDGATRPVPSLLADDDTYGWWSFAQPQATHRLFTGSDGDLQARLMSAVRPADQPAVMQAIFESVRQPVHPSMPLADAVALARFMVDTTVGYIHHLHGPDTVGGEVEVAGVSPYEGFKWVARKHYYGTALNPHYSTPPRP